MTQTHQLINPPRRNQRAQRTRLALLFLLLLPFSQVFRTRQLHWASDHWQLQITLSHQLWPARAHEAAKRDAVRVHTASRRQHESSSRTRQAAKTETLKNITPPPTGASNGRLLPLQPYRSHQHKRRNTSNCTISTDIGSAHYQSTIEKVGGWIASLAALGRLGAVWNGCRDPMEKFDFVKRIHRKTRTACSPHSASTSTVWHSSYRKWAVLLDTRDPI